MKLIETKLKGLMVLEPEVSRDKRGYFFRTFAEDELKKHGLNFKIVQANMSVTVSKGTVRGMHFQRSPKAEDKIVQCFSGAIYDVAVDLRESSPTYGKWFGLELNDSNHKMLLIPKGFAHGFQTLTDDCIVHYFMTEYYTPELASGVRFDDPLFKISWPDADVAISERDRNWPLLSR